MGNRIRLLPAIFLGRPRRSGPALFPSAFLIAAAAVPLASAQSTGRVHLDLPAGPVSAALRIIAAQTGTSFGTDDPGLLRRRTRRLRIDAPADRAIDAVLAGTGLRARRVGPASWRIAVAPPPPRPEPAQPRPQRVNVPPAAGREAIVVTGSKLDAPLERYPASVAIIDGDDLAHSVGDHGTLAIAELHPSLLSTRLGPGRNKLFLRGVSDSSFAGASPSLVGQYLGDMRLTYASPDPDLRLYDIARVEVLEGPQGSLYGAGSLGGVLRIVPNAPDPERQSGSVWTGATVTVHGAPGVDAGLVANLPLGERSAIRILGYHEYAGGYIDDVQRGRRNINATRVDGGRIAAHLPLGARWSMDLAAIGQDVRNADSQYEERSLGRLVRASAFAQPSHHFYRALSVSVSGPLAGARVQSTWGLVDQRLAQLFDATLLGEGTIAYHQRDHILLLSNETRVTAAFGRRWEGLVGIAALRSIGWQDRSLGAESHSANLGSLDARVAEATLFGEMRWQPATQLTVSAGGRLSFVDMRGSATGVLAKPAPGTSPPSPTRSQWLSTPTLALAWTPGRQATFYARYAGGYRPGGLTVRGAVERFDPDTVRTAEIGFRVGQSGTARVHVDGSLSHTDWRNVQADTVDALGLPHTANIGDGVVRTATLQIGFSPVRGLTATAGGFLASSRLVGELPAIEGVVRSALPNVARYGAILSVGYVRRMTSGDLLRAGLHVHSVGKSILGIGPPLDIRQGDYTYFSGNLGWEIGRATLTLEAFNLFDARGNLFALGTPFALGNDTQGTPLRPRSLRLALLLRVP